MQSDIPARLDNNEIETRLLKLDEGWSYDSERLCLYKKFQFKGFLKTMSFVNAVAWVANLEKHHPDMEVSFNTCLIRYQTHDAGGVTENDFSCAHAIDNLKA